MLARLSVRPAGLAARVRTRPALPIGRRLLSADALGEKIDRALAGADPVPAEAVDELLQACTRAAKTAQADKAQLAAVVAAQARLLADPRTPLDIETLRTFFLTRPPTAAAVEALRAFNSRNAGSAAYVPRDVYMIPFYKALRDYDTAGAFALIDQSSASPLWIRHIKRQAWKYFAIWTQVAGGTMLGAEALMQSGLLGEVEHTLGIHMMLAVYLANSSLFGVVALASRPGDNGGPVRFRPGTLQHKWYLKAQETRMLNQIVEMDRLRAGNDLDEGDPSLFVKDELIRRGRRLDESEHELVWKEYWARYGQGFEWAEPDQDPAEHARLQARSRERLASPSQPVETGWADNLLGRGPGA
ncbi:uncharacterized protein V1510DRAFT_390523 [Dipodascopsis tothii]|uniref:uncharacterized protein n=1 Tax=Dipodascopsis tothii TaxID=44089 RepID=UPI0034CF3F4F